VNFRLIDFFVFDLRRSLSPDLHESCDFKLKNHSLESLFNEKSPYIFSLFEENMSKSLIFGREIDKDLTLNWVFTALFDVNRIDFVQSA